MVENVEHVEKYIERSENLCEVLGYIVRIIPQTALALGVLAAVWD